MRVVGRRKESLAGAATPGELLAIGARFVEECRNFPSKGSTFVPKGVYRFATHEDADAHRNACLAQGMAKLAQKWQSQAKDIP